MQNSVYQYISQKTGDKIVERKKCKISGQDFPIFQSDLDFYNKISPVFNGQKYQIPTPKLCPQERSRRRMIFRNERKLYRSKCALTNKPILTVYNPDNGYIVYDNNVRRSDQRNVLDYGQAFDFGQNFTTQFGKLLRKVPHPAVFNTNSENSLFCNHVGDMKNAYLTSASWDCENTLYGNKCFGLENCVDIHETFESNSCYQTIECEKSYKLQHSQQCENCRDSYFLFDCYDCDNCFGCRNLVGKKNYFFNQELSPQAYQAKIKQYIGSRINIQLVEKQRIEEVQKHSVRKPFQALNSENSRGNRISNSQNCIFSYNISDLKDCKYVENAAQESADLYDVFGAGLNSYLTYEGIDTGLKVFRSISTYVVHECNNTYYSRNCKGCSNIFGCVGLVNQQYCIFNKQYTKQEYENLVTQIISHMQSTGERGEFFDPTIGPFDYNESIAQENYPLTHTQALDRGYSWFEGSWDTDATNIANTIDSANTLDKLGYSEEILDRIIICEESNRPFKIIKQELEFYKKNKILLPIKHPDIRHQSRIKKKASRELYLISCKKCGVEMISIYSNDDKHVYCDSCYNFEIY